MMEFLGNFYGMPLYTDKYMDDNKILKGRKGNESVYLIANPKTANFMYKMYLTKLRKEKLNKINSLC